MAKNLLKVIHILENLQQAEHLRMLNVMVCNQQRLATDSVRTRSWSGDSKNYYAQDFGTGSWHKMCYGKIPSTLQLPEQKEHHAVVANDLIQTATNEQDS